MEKYELKDEVDMVYEMYNGGDFIDVGAHSDFTFLIVHQSKAMIIYVANQTVCT